MVLRQKVSDEGPWLNLFSFHSALFTNQLFFSSEQVCSWLLSGSAEVDQMLTCKSSLLNLTPLILQKQTSDCGRSNLFLGNPTEMETELFLFLLDVTLEFSKSKIQEQDENTDSLCYTKECAGNQPVLLQILSFFWHWTVSLTKGRWKLF